MHPPLSAQRVLEVLYRVGDIDAAAFDANVGQRFVEDAAPAGPTNGSPGLVFLVARLLADEEHPRVGRALTENRLCRPRTTDSRGSLAPLCGASAKSRLAGRKSAADVSKTVHVP